MRSVGFPQVKHLADAGVTNLAGQFEFIGEPLDALPVGSDFWLDQFEGDFFFDLGVKNFIDPPHPSFSELFDNLIAAGKGAAGGQFFNGCLESLRGRNNRFLWRRKRSRTLILNQG